MVASPNVLVILSDEHAADASGFAGHPHVRTPHLDQLAETATVYGRAYCNSPMCVPSRLSLFSGRYVHEVGAWDNEVVPSPQLRTWGDHLRPAGYRSTLIGRAHINGPDRLLGFDSRPVDDNVRGLAATNRPTPRTPDWQRPTNSHVSEVGVGDHYHTEDDRRATAAAVQYLRDQAGAQAPFLLYVGYMHPHFPFVVPPEYADRYDPADVELPPDWNEPTASQHPVIAHLRHSFRNDEPLSEDEVRSATAAYWSLITHVDDQIGMVLAALQESGLCDNTVIIYSSDHGEMAGRHGIWQKQCFYEPAVRVPLMIRIPGGRTGQVDAPVSGIDLLPTLRDLAGLPVDDQLPGKSLLGDGPEPDRPVFAEYHAQGMLTGGFMFRHGQYKLCSYAGQGDQLFDLHADPGERRDLVGDPAHAETLNRLKAELAKIGDIEAIDRAARADQASRAGT